MKHPFLITLSLLLGFSTLMAQPAKETTTNNKAYNSLLWEISGNGLETSSYLFGTIHMIGEKDFFLTDVMKEKFAKTEQLALEIDMDNPMIMLSVLTGLNMKGGTTLDKLVTKEEYAKLKEHYCDKMGLPVSMFRRMKPMLVSSMGLEMAGEGKEQEAMKSYEMEFMEMAKKDDFKILGLESAAYQVRVLDSIPYEEQAKMLVASLDESGNSDMDEFDKMVELYKNQDLDGLYDIIASPDSELGKYEDILLNNRNRNWIPVIGKFAKQKPTFIAVGAGHLPGEFGVINLLRKAGYTVKAIK